MPTIASERVEGWLISKLRSRFVQSADAVERPYSLFATVCRKPPALQRHIASVFRMDLPVTSRYAQLLDQHVRR